jgi:hypothetical protein
VAEQLREVGIAAAALTGGIAAWKALYAVEPIEGAIGAGI